jgi:hypothetical protein
MREIRFLVENYYDIQKLRVETFNRIVMFVKENADEILKVLSQSCLEPPCRGANHKDIESHGFYASHQNNENQLRHAVELLKKKKYAEFVKKYVLSQVWLESHLIHAGQLETEFQAKHVSHFGFETQHSFAILQNSKQIENLIWFHNRLYQVEKELYKKLDAWSKNHPLRVKYLDYVKGIGGVLASGIIAWLSLPILKAEKVSQIWKYCGLFPGSERKRGEKLEYNLKLKTFCWKIGQSFIKFKCFGRELYDNFKEETKRKHPDWTKLHVHNYARRKVVKLFLASVWEVWRKMNNLPVTEPYPIAFLGHQTKITPEMWMEKGEK